MITLSELDDTLITRLNSDQGVILINRLRSFLWQNGSGRKSDGDGRSQEEIGTRITSLIKAPTSRTSIITYITIERWRRK